MYSQKNLRVCSENSIGTVYTLLVLANILAWAWAWWAFYRHPALMGTALLAWVFGLRHALDADHLAAIDNVVRKLMQQQKKPLYAGLYFSLGHSTIVILATIGVALATVSLHRHIQALQSVGQILGTAMPALFLLILAVVNTSILLDVWRCIRQLRCDGALKQASLQNVLNGTGLMTRIFRPMLRAIDHSWQMYPIGFLFGLGFDTASEVGLLALSAAQAAHGISLMQVLALPALFTAGMMLVDTTDSVLMVGAYGWALMQPFRKLWYNLTITAASVMMALFVGGVEITGLIGSRFGLHTGVWSVVARLNENLAIFGLCTIGIFGFCWMVSSVMFRGYRDIRELYPQESNLS